MRYVAYLLNLPWTILGVVLALSGFPYKVNVKSQAIIFYCLTCGLVRLYAPKAKGFAMGNVVGVKKGVSEKILTHELVHVEQHMRQPFIYFFLYYFEFFRNGYWNNKYEVEAYTRSDTWPDPKKRRWY